MFNWNDWDQYTLWGDSKEIEDHIVPQPEDTEGNTSFAPIEFSRKQGNDDSDLINSTMEKSEAKLDFFMYDAKNRSCTNADQELDDSSLDIDTWTDLPTLGTALSQGFNDVHDQDSVETGLASDLADASELNSAAGVMAGFNCRGSSSLSRPYILLTGNEMQVDGEHKLLGNDGKEKDRFLDYDWADFEDFDDFDKMFRSNGSMFGNEMMDNADTFLTASTDVISSTAQSIPVPDLPISGEHDCEKGFSSGDLVEQSDLMIDSVQKNKAADLTMKGEGATVSHTYLTSESSGICSQISFKMNLPNQTVTAAKKMEEKGKARSSQRLGNSWSNKNQKVSNPTMQTSSPNPPPTYQSKPVEQISSSNHVAFSDYGFAACQFPGMSLPPQHIGFKAHPEYSKKPKPAVPQAVIMTPKEKIEKLRRRQQMQAMLAIQKQREQYNHQISGNDCNQNKEDYKQKFLPSDVSSLGEQDQSHIISSSAEGCVEEAIYFQLQDALGKLDMRVRLNIRDSLYRLARSAMERQSASDRSSTNKSSKEEDDISAGEESNNQDRYEPMADSEAVTNPLDRIVAQLLFHNPSSSPMPSADGSMSMATSL